MAVAQAIRLPAGNVHFFADTIAFKKRNNVLPTLP